MINILADEFRKISIERGGKPSTKLNDIYKELILDNARKDAEQGLFKTHTTFRPEKGYKTTQFFYLLHDFKKMGFKTTYRVSKTNPELMTVYLDWEE